MQENIKRMKPWQTSHAFSDSESDESETPKKRMNSIFEQENIKTTEPWQTSHESSDDSDDSQGQEEEQEKTEEKIETGVYVKSTSTNNDNSRVYDKLNTCYYCEKEFLKVGRHFQQLHKDCPEVIKALSFAPKSAERRMGLDRIRLMGNFVHNNKVLEANVGELKVVRRPSVGTGMANPFEYLPCLYCNGFFHQKELYKHVEMCPFAEGKKESHPRRLRYTCSMLLASNKSSLVANKALTDHIFPRMKSDQISLAAKNDGTIVRYGKALVGKHGKDMANYVSQHMRELARLLVEARKLSKMPSQTMKDFIAPAGADSNGCKGCLSNSQILPETDFDQISS